MNIVSIPLYEKNSSMKYTLSPFVAGPENHVLCTAVYEVLADGNLKFPVLFHAPFGFGKSHLARGTFYAWQSEHPNAAGKQTTARDFLKQWNTFQKARKISEFHHSYHRLDFLVLEDLHEISGEEETQDVLVSTLERLRLRNARILITSNVPPTQLALLPKLASRIREGAGLRIENPMSEARREILLLDRNCRGMRFSEDGVEHLAACSAKTGQSVFEMLNIKRQLEMQRRTTGAAAVTSGDVQNFFEKKAENCTITIADIAKLAAKHYRVKLSDIRGKSRRATLVFVRDVTYYLARKMTGFTLLEIGDYFGGRDHTTILHGCSRIEDLLKTDSDVRQTVDYLYRELRPLIDSPVTHTEHR